MTEVGSATGSRLLVRAMPEVSALRSHSGSMPPLDAEFEPAVAFILSLAQALHGYGVSAHRLEGMLTLVALRLGVEARFYSTPTAVIASFGPRTEERVCLVRVQPGEIDLEKVYLLHESTVKVIRGELGLEAGRERVAAIVRAPRRFGSAAVIACFGLSSAAAAVFFGGGWAEIAASLVVGLGVGAIAGVAGRWSRGFSVLEPIAAAFAALTAAVASRYVTPLSTLVVTLAGVVTLLPGLGITTAMTELATRNLASGTARFSGALVQLIGLGFGVALGGRIVAAMPGVAPPSPLAVTPPFAMLAVAVVVAALAFAVLLQARPADMGWIVVSGAVAFGGARLGAHLIGPELGAFVGALLVGLGSNLLARLLDRPAAITVVPGLLILVPGSIGFRSVFSMLEQDVVSGVSAAFTMVLVSTALVAGILFANIALPTRRAL